MTKEEVRERVLHKGKRIRLEDFTWDKNTKVFSSKLNHLVIDFNGISDCTFKTGSGCTFKTSWGCTFDTGLGCTFDTGLGCTFDTGLGCTFDTGLGCTFDTGLGCTFKTGSDCTFKTSWGCTFKTSLGCTFKTGSGCTFDTGSDCIFDTGWDCTFDTDSDCTFDTGSNCVVIRRDIYEVIELEEGSTYTLFPHSTKGYLKDGLYDNKPHIIIDNIVSEVINKKGNIYKVKNLGQDKITYIVQDGDLYSHGDTIKEAKESLIYKISNIDTSEYESLTLDSILTKSECIKMYRAITGACEAGTRYFVEGQQNVKDKYSVGEIINLTKGQYGWDKLNTFFERRR